MKFKILTVFLLLSWNVPVRASDTPVIEHHYVSSGEDLTLIPRREESKSVYNYIAQKQPSYGIEMLYEFPGRGDIDWEELYFKLRSISRLEEVWYFSEHAGKYRYMFPRAYVIESLSKKSRLPDYTLNTVFDDAEIFALLDDAELKDGRYRVSYTVTPGSIQIRVLNATPLRRFIKVVDREDFYLDFLFYEDEGLKVYIYGAYSLKNEFIVLKLLKYPFSTLSKRVYTIFSALIGDFHGADLPEDFPDFLRE